MSWTSAASRTIGRSGDAASTDRRVWSHRSSSGTLFWGIPRRTGLDPGEGGRLDPEVERGRQPDGPDHAQGVLLEAGSWLADGPKHPGRDVGSPAVRVDQGRLAARPGAPGHRVDGEVTAGQVQIDRARVLDPVRPPEVGIVVVAPERRDLVQLTGARHRHRAEPVLIRGLGKELEEPLGQRIRRQVPIGRGASQQHVAQRTTDHVAGLARRPERLEELADRRGDRVLDRRQLRPRKRYVRHASLRSSPRYGVNSE